MKTLFISIIFGVYLSCSAQGISHKIGVIPLSIYVNKKFFFAQGLQYTALTKSNQFSITTEGTILSILDGRERYARPRNIAFIPKLNQSEVSYGRQFFMFNRKPTNANRVYGKAGFHYIQHGTETNSDYWKVDTVNNGGFKVLSGFRTYSASIGLNWEHSRSIIIESNELLTKSKHWISASYIYGIGIQLNGFDDFQTNSEKTSIPNIYSFNRQGLKLNYQYEWFFSSRVSFYANLEFLYVPFIYFEPNNSLFVPRGGERIRPIFTSLKFGVNFYKTSQAPKRILSREKELGKYKK